MGWVDGCATVDRGVMIFFHCKPISQGILRNVSFNLSFGRGTCAVEQRRGDGEQEGKQHHGRGVVLCKGVY
jgi:hypothetical protein